MILPLSTISTRMITNRIIKNNLLKAHHFPKILILAQNKIKKVIITKK